MEIKGGAGPFGLPRLPTHQGVLAHFSWIQNAILYPDNSIKWFICLIHKIRFRAGRRCPDSVAEMRYGCHILSSDLFTAGATPLYLLLFSGQLPSGGLPRSSPLRPSASPFHMEVPRSSRQSSPRCWVARQSNACMEAIDKGLSHRCGRVRTLLRPTKESSHLRLSGIYVLFMAVETQLWRAG